MKISDSEAKDRRRMKEQTGGENKPALWLLKLETKTPQTLNLRSLKLLTDLESQTASTQQHTDNKRQIVVETLQRQTRGASQQETDMWWQQIKFFCSQKINKRTITALKEKVMGLTWCTFIKMFKSEKASDTQYVKLCTDLIPHL